MSGLAMSTLATWSHVVQSRDVRSRDFSVPVEPMVVDDDDDDESLNGSWINGKGELRPGGRMS